MDKRIFGLMLNLLCQFLAQVHVRAHLDAARASRGSTFGFLLAPRKGHWALGHLCSKASQAPIRPMSGRFEAGPGTQLAVFEGLDMVALQSKEHMTVELC